MESKELTLPTIIKSKDLTFYPSAQALKLDLKTFSYGIYVDGVFIPQVTVVLYLYYKDKFETINEQQHDIR